MFILDNAASRELIEPGPTDRAVDRDSPAEIGLLFTTPQTSALCV
jgi:hypothetical protein